MDQLKFMMSQKVVKYLKTNSSFSLLFLLILLSIIPRVWNLTLYPPVIIDEPAFLRDIAKIFATGNYYFAHPQWDASQAYLTYYPVLLFIIVGIPGFLALRLESVILSILGIIPFFFLVKRYTNTITAFCTSLIFSYSYYYLQFSRVGWGATFATTFGLFSIWILIVAIEKKSVLLFATSSIFAAISFYSYRGVEIYLLAELLLFIVYFFSKNISIKQKVIFTLVFLDVFLILVYPWVLYITSPHNQFFLRSHNVAIQNADLPYLGMTNWIKIYMHQITTAISSWVLMIPMHGNGGHIENLRYLPLRFPPISLILIPFFWLGMILSLLHLKKYYVWWFIFLVGLLCGQVLTVFPPNGARAFILLPIVYLFIGLALYKISSVLKNIRFINLLMVLFCILVACSDLIFYAWWMTWIRVM